MPPHVVEGEVNVVNDLGIHTRTAALFVQEARRFSSVIELSLDGQVADGKSILEILTLGAGQGKTIRLRAEGEDADAAFAALGSLIARGFEGESS